MGPRANGLVPVQIQSAVHKIFGRVPCDAGWSKVTAIGWWRTPSLPQGLAHQMPSDDSHSYSYSRSEYDLCQIVRVSARVTDQHLKKNRTI